MTQIDDLNHGRGLVISAARQLAEQLYEEIGRAPLKWGFNHGSIYFNFRNQWHGGEHGMSAGHYISMLRPDGWENLERGISFDTAVRFISIFRECRDAMRKQLQREINGCREILDKAAAIRADDERKAACAVCYGEGVPA